MQAERLPDKEVTLAPQRDSFQLEKATSSATRIA
jgi:hypothetical protein